MNMKKNTIAILVAGAAFCLLVAFSTSLAQKQQKLTDPEIAAIAVAANKIDIEAANIAKSKSKSNEVLQFAQTMITDHQSVIDKATALVTKLGVTPKENAISRQLVAQSKKTAKMLQLKTGKAFDKAYVDNEVAYHKAVIDLVSSRLIPESQNNELKELLSGAAPIFKAHLEHAQMTQKNVDK